MALVLDKVRGMPDRALEAVAFASDGTSEEVIRGVLNEMGTDAIVKRGDIKAATQYVTDHPSPRLLVVDVSGSDLPLSDVQALAEHCEPRVRVVVLGDKNDVGLFRELIQLGASDYVVKPVTRDLAQRAFGKALGHEAASPNGERAGKLIAVIGARGGVGATTVASNVGWLLSNREGRRVTLLDLDLHCGALGLMLDVKPSRGLREALENATRIDDLFVERLLSAHSERLSVVCGEEPHDEKLSYNVDAASGLLDVLRRRSHYVVVDVPRHPDPVFRHVLKAADTRIVVADQTLASARDAMRYLAPIEGGPIEQRTMLVVNRRTQPSKGDVPMEDYERTLDRKVDHVVPNGRGGVAAAGNLGDVAAAGRTPVTNALAGIAADLSGGAAVENQPVWKKFLRSA